MKRIYIAVDMEGAASIFSDQETSPGHHAYDEARKQLLGEVNAAVEGAFLGGADEVYVHDYHGGLHNLNVNDLDDRAGQVRGHGMPNVHLPGIEDNFDGLLVVGAHGPRNDSDTNTLAHVINGGVFDFIEINGINVGETIIDAWLAGTWDVPLLFVTGETGAVEETQRIYPDVPHVITKQGLHYHAAISRPVSQVVEEIRSGAESAVKKDGKVLVPSQPVEVTLRFNALKHAGVCDLLPECFDERQGKTVHYTTEDFFTAYRRILAALLLAGFAD